MRRRRSTAALIAELEALGDRPELQTAAEVEATGAEVMRRRRLRLAGDQPAKVRVTLDPRDRIFVRPMIR